MRRLSGWPLEPWAACANEDAGTDRPHAPIGLTAPFGPIRYDLRVSPLERHELISPLERALVVISHPDDGEFGAGPTIAKLTGSGVRVDYVVTTDGAKGTEDPDVTPEQLARLPGVLFEIGKVVGSD